MEGDAIVQVISAIGFIRVRDPGNGFFPCSVDVDVELTLAPMGPIPAKDRFLVEGLSTPCD
jgi:hypothetical protein